MRSLEEVLHDRVVHLEELLHLLDQVLRLLLSSLVLVSQPVHLFIEVRLDRFKLDMEALLIALNVNLQVPLIRLIVVDVVVEDLVDVDNLLLDLLRCRDDLFSELLDALEPSTRAFKDGFRDEHVRITHEFLILAHLCIEQIRKDVTCDYFVLLASNRCDGSLGFCAQLPVCLLGVQA